MYTHPERSDPEAGMQEIIDLTGGLKLSEVHMEAQEMQGLNEIMNEDDLDSEEEEFRYELKGKGASTNYVARFCPLLTSAQIPSAMGWRKRKLQHEV